MLPSQVHALVERQCNRRYDPPELAEVAQVDNPDFVCSQHARGQFQEAELRERRRSATGWRIGGWRIGGQGQAQHNPCGRTIGATKVDRFVIRSEHAFCTSDTCKEQVSLRFGLDPCSVGEDRGCQVVRKDLLRIHAYLHQHHIRVDQYYHGGGPSGHSTPFLVPRRCSMAGRRNACVGLARRWRRWYRRAAEGILPAQAGKPCGAPRAGVAGCDGGKTTGRPVRAGDPPAHVHGLCCSGGASRRASTGRGQPPARATCCRGTGDAGGDKDPS
eukprot:scaffold469_cov282-Pinguiococcus_pyrenoidosus.AAC.1